MDPRLYADQLERTALRFRARTDSRTQTRAVIDARGPLAADTPERVTKRLERLRVSPALVDAVVRDRAAGEAGAPEVPVLAAEKRDVVVLERLLGTNDLIGVGFLEAGYLAGRAVGRITVTTREGRGFGTGSMISPRLLMTNNHVLGSAMDAANARVEFAYELDLDGNETPAVAFDFDPDAFFATDANLDYTIVAVGTAADAGRLRAFRFNRLIADEGKVLLGEAVNIIQHPSGERKQLALRENELIDVLDDFIQYHTDTAPGSSGAPVFNDQWELVALHHSGVPQRDAAGKILAQDGRVWTEAMGEGQIAWIANEGARVSRIVRHLKTLPLTGPQLALREEVFTAVPERPAGDAPPPPPHPELASSALGATLTVPLQITITLGTPGEPAIAVPVAGAAAPAVAAAAPVPAPAVLPAAAEPDDHELAAALAELRRSDERVYYAEARDRIERERYYEGIAADLDADALYQALSQLVTETHARPLTYKPAQRVYPWVDLRPDRKLRSIYSGKPLDPEELIREDFAAERAFRESVGRLRATELMSGHEARQVFDALEAAFPFNCEHVVPQSWFEKHEPMRGDLHHLFACEPGCNSFRGNQPYFDFRELEEVVRDACGRREREGFEPAAGKGTVARAVMYFLLRYPGLVSVAEFPPERLQILLGWHADDAVDRYERHRNQAIFELQGNRNPLVDHAEWAESIGFAAALGAALPG